MGLYQVFDGGGNVTGLTESPRLVRRRGRQCPRRYAGYPDAINSLTQGTVLFGVGNFKVTSTITTKPWVHLIGSDRSTCHIRPVARFVGNVIELKADKVTYGGITIRNLTVEGVQRADATGCGFSFTNIHDIIIEDVTVGYCNEGVHLAGGWGHYLKNVYAGNNVEIGFMVGSEYAHLLNCRQTVRPSPCIWSAHGSQSNRLPFQGATHTSVKLSGDCRGAHFISNYLTQGGAPGNARRHHR